MAPVIAKLRQRFPLRRVVLVGDRGLWTDARIREELTPVEGLDGITALRHPTIRPLVDSGARDLGHFAHTDLIALTAPADPDERLMACANATLADARERTREALLPATARELETIRQATTRAKRRLTGQGNMALRVGKVLQRCKVGKHFPLEIADPGGHYQRDHQSIAAEAALDGLYVLRTRVPAAALDAAHTVRAYKSLATVERAFRSLKTVALSGRPSGAGRMCCSVCWRITWSGIGDRP